MPYTHHTNPRGFNPRPPLSRGAMSFYNLVSSNIKVSIRAPRFREGRFPFVGGNQDLFKFQSAPPAFARGDDVIAAHVP